MYEPDCILQKNHNPNSSAINTTWAIQTSFIIIVRDKFKKEGVHGICIVSL